MSSQITIINQTNEVIHVGVFKQPLGQASLKSIAWMIVAPPPAGGRTVISIPSNYGVYASYGNHQDPYSGYKTPTIEFSETTARFETVNVESPDKQVEGIILKQLFTQLVANEVHIDNNADQGVWGHITLDGSDLFAPQVIPPGTKLMEDIRGNVFYLAVLNKAVTAGQKIDVEVISDQVTPILQGQTATVTGSEWEGYAISVS